MIGLDRPLPPVARGGAREALRFGERGLSYDELRAAACEVAAGLTGVERVALWATPEPETCVGLIGALLAGAAVVPLNPQSGERELAHILGDSAPNITLASPGALVPKTMTGRVARMPDDFSALARKSRRRRDRTRPQHAPDPGPSEPPPPDAPALIVYTSGTTGPPKGAVLSRGAVAANLDALADAWAWTSRDVLVHGLPLFHVHGLVLGVLGPLRRGGALRHLGRFSVEGVVDAFEAGATMLFGVPTMYHRLADAADRDPRVAAALGRARVLVSGSAPLGRADAERIERASGRRVLQRYGLTETLILTAERADAPGAAGTVGPPLPGVELRLVDDDGREIPRDDRDTIGEVLARGPGLFDGYLGRPDATSAALRDGWFATGDLAVWAPGGALRIVGRRATDLIKSGGFKLGAGEIEAALLEHPAVAECAVTGEPDPDLGERVVAWVVPAGGAAAPSEQELIEHVAATLAPHKRPREVHFVDALPRNAMGKVLKRELATAAKD